MEIWDLYLENGEPTGRQINRNEQIPKGFYHLVSEILVRHTDGDHLLTQRDPQKKSYGGRFEASAGGSVQAGEDALAGAKRELLEETGIEATSWEHLDVHRAGNEICHSFLCVTDCDKSSVRLQEGETVSYRWLNEEDFANFVCSDEIIDFQKEHFKSYFIKMGYIEKD